MNKKIGNKCYLLSIESEEKKSGSRQYENIPINDYVKSMNVKHGTTFALYRQHKNGFFYLKRIGKCMEIVSNHVLIDPDNPYMSGIIKWKDKVSFCGKKVAIVLFGYRYGEKLISMLPDCINPYGLDKGKNSKIHHEVIIEPVRLFDKI